VEHPHSFGEPATRELNHVVELSVKSFVSTVEVPRSQYRLCPAMHLSRLAQSLRLRIVTDYLPCLNFSGRNTGSRHEILARDVIDAQRLREPLVLLQRLDSGMFALLYPP
jgi:hypothetical protein